MGVDGEGWGVNEHGQQHYMMLQAGPYELYTGKPLTTRQCLEFICSLPDTHILAGYGFGYDTTMILRDLAPERVARLFTDKPRGAGRSPYTYVGDFGIEYIPKNYLRVCRTETYRTHDVNGVTYLKRRVVPGTTRTIWETAGFFQKSFLGAAQDFDVGREHWELIKRNKKDRSNFAKIKVAEIRKYNAIECDLLAQLMDKFRAICLESDLRPRTWNGSGKLAAALHTTHHTLKAVEIASLVPHPVLQMATTAYYGGRFEVTRPGEIIGPIYEYDLGSAYPAAMRDLPCLLHGRWRKANAAWLAHAKPDALYVANVRFRHDGLPLCGLPIRQKSGRLFWPEEGQGTYWSCEIQSAQRLGATVWFDHGWRYVRGKGCKCRSFDWIEPLFQRRRALGKDMRGLPLKYGLNSVYGKLAQRLGAKPWANFIWAGLVTARVRAQLNDAAAQAPRDILMIATDALFSKTPLQLDLGNGLGQWEAKQHNRMFVVQPGLYWGAAKPKTRGVPLDESFLEKHAPAIEAEWRNWCDKTHATPGYVYDMPQVQVPITLFVGLKLAHARGKPETAGVWHEREAGTHKKFKFDWTGKRSRGLTWEGRYSLNTLPHRGHPDLISLPHKGDESLMAALDLENAQLEDQPDHMNFSPFNLGE
jgi:hypothetical protein